MEINEIRSESKKGEKMLTKKIDWNENSKKDIKKKVEIESSNK